MRVPVGPAAWAAAVVGRVLGATWRYGQLSAGAATGRARRVRPPRSLEPAVYALWHEHLLPLAVLHRGSGAVALVSQHRDGEILARVLDRMGYGAARGSSTRGGARGLARMIEAGRRGRALAFTPDGPRGPARRCKPGVVRAAAETGLPVVPVAAAASRGRRLSSWDRFLVPAPAARVVVAYGAPMEIPAEVARAWEGDELADRKVAGRWTQRLEGALERQRVRCERAVRGAPEVG